MPGGDRTGPMGMGPMTGRAAGFCAGNNVPGYMNPYGGRGMGYRWGGMGGRGRGGGFGRRRGFFAQGAYPELAPGAAPYPYDAPMPFDAGAELDALQNQAQSLRSALENIEKRIGELETKASDTES